MDLNKKATFRRSRSFKIPKDFVFDYKDVQRLSQFVTERGKILPRRTVGLSRKHQKQLENAIKRARNLGLMPFTIHNFKVDFRQFAEMSTRMQGTQGGYRAYRGRPAEDRDRSGGVGESSEGRDAEKLPEESKTSDDRSGEESKSTNNA